MNFLDPVLNGVEVTVSTGYDDDDTSVVLESGEGAKLPAPSTDGNFNLVWYNSSDYRRPFDDPNVEIIRVTGLSADTLTIVRPAVGNSDNGEGSTNTAKTHNTGGKIYKMILTATKNQFDKIDNLTITVERVWAIAGEIKVPDGDTDYIVPIPIYVPAGKSVTLSSVEMLINSGTSATFKVKQKTTVAESYADVATGLVADTTPSNKTALSSNNVLSGGESGTMFLVAIEVTAVSGTPKNLSVMISYTKTIFQVMK